MQPSELEERLKRVRVVSVQVKLREKAVVAGVEGSGLWPRVTLELDGSRESVSLTDYAEPERVEDRKKFDKMESATLRVAGVNGRAMRAVKKSIVLTRALHETSQKARKRIASGVSKARATNKLRTRIEAAQRKKRRTIAIRKLETTFQDILKRTVKLKDLSGTEVARIWDRIKLEEVVDEVHDL